LHLDGAPVPLNQRLGDCQPKADPLGPGGEQRLGSHGSILQPHR
jgi:hypothetical protein